jgi:hypothetical protein
MTQQEIDLIGYEIFQKKLLIFKLEVNLKLIWIGHCHCHCHQQLSTRQEICYFLSI